MPGLLEEPHTMLSSSRELLSFRTLALLPPLLFLPALVSFFIAPGSRAVEYPGILFHLSILFLVSRMDAPMWGRAAGFSWVALDVLSGALALNYVPHDIAWPVRLGAHIFGGLWIFTVSVLARPLSIRIVGGVTGFWLGFYTFVATLLPDTFLRPTGISIIVWFILLAMKYEPGRARLDGAGGS